MIKFSLRQISSVRQSDVASILHYYMMPSESLMRWSPSQIQV